MTCTSLSAQYDGSGCAHVLLVSEFSWTSQDLIHCINERVKEEEEGLLHVETAFFFLSSVQNQILTEECDVQNVETVRMLSKSCFE